MLLPSALLLVAESCVRLIGIRRQLELRKPSLSWAQAAEDRVSALDG